MVDTCRETLSKVPDLRQGPSRFERYGFCASLFGDCGKEGRNDVRCLWGPFSSTAVRESTGKIKEKSRIFTGQWEGDP